MSAIPEKVTAVLVETTKEAEDIAYLRLATYAEPPTYPINWDSEKQKRAFFASSGFGGGIPHSRQGALPNSFEESEITASEGLVEGRVFSPEDWVRFVMSEESQSNIHAGRWPTDTGIAQDITPEVVKLYNDALLHAVEEALGAQ